MKKNLFLNLFFTVTIGILGFVVNRVFSDTMGTEALGLMRLFTQMVAYLNLANLGIASASTYALYKPLANNDINRVSIVISTIDSYYKMISIIILVLGSMVSLLLPKLINTISYGNYIYIFWILYVINTALSYTFAKYSILLTADQKYGLVRTIQGSSKVLLNIMQLLILIYTQSFLLFVLIMIGQNIFNYFFFNKHFQYNYKKIKKVKDREKQIIKDMKNLFWHSIGSLVVYNTDFILLSKYTSLEIVAIYSSYLIVYQMVVTIIGVLTPVLTPKIGNFIAQHNKLDIFKFWEKLHLLYMITGSIIVTVTFYVLNPFIGLWMGIDYILPSLTVSLLLVNLFIQITRAITDVFKTNSGFYNDIYNPIFESIINLLVSLILVQKIGLNGVIIGTITSNIAVTFVLKPIMTFVRCFDKKIKDYIFIYTKYLLIVGVTIFISNYMINYFEIIGNIDSWINWILISTKTAVVVGVINGIVFLMDVVYRREVKKLLLRNINFKLLDKIGVYSEEKMKK